MRICYVAHSDAHFIPPYVDYFAVRGHEVHVISCHPDDLPGAIMHHPVGPTFDPYQASWSYFWIQRKVCRLIAEIRPDLLHAHYLTSNGFMAALSGFHPFIVSARGSDVHQGLAHPLKRRLIRFAMNRADLVNPVSRDLEAKILSLGIPADKIFRLTQGIEVGRFTVEQCRRSGPVRIICTRRLVPHYQCDLIIKGLAMLAVRNTPFAATFAASGSQEAELRSLAVRLGIGDRVRFLGGYSNQELPAMLADSDIYVSASLWDGTSPALLEAMAAGVFPVVSDITANREWLTGEGDGLLFDPTSVEQLAACLERAACDESLRGGAADLLRERVKVQADREANLSKLAAQYERLCGQRSRSRQGVTA